MNENTGMLQKLIKRLLTPSPCKVGIFVTLLMLIFVHTIPNYFHNLDNFVRSIDAEYQDLMFNIRGSITEKDLGKQFSSVIVDIDEKSLNKLGQWPWPRYVIAELLTKIDKCKPKAIGLDVVFAEPDRSSLKNNLRRYAKALAKKVELPEDLSSMEPEKVGVALQKIFGKNMQLSPQILTRLDNDAILAEVIENSKTIVTGYFFNYQDDGLADGSVPYGAGGFVYARKKNSIQGSPFVVAKQIPYRPVLNIEILDDASEDRSGCFSTSFDETGKVREVPLLWEFKGNLYPLLALQMLRIGMGINTSTVSLNEKGIDYIRLKEKGVYTNWLGKLYVNFYGKGKTFKYVSAVDIIENKIPTEVFKDKYILLGTSAGGLLDLRVNPFDDKYPGVEVHATIIDNIINDNFFRIYPFARAYEYIFVIIIGVFLSFALTRTQPLLGAFIAILSTFSLGLWTYREMMDNHNVFYIAYPIVALFLVFMTVTMFNYFFEGKQKKFIKGAFSTYLSSALVDKMMANPETLSLTGDEKELTVMFSDIRGFTSISEKLTAQQLSEFLNEYLTPMSDIVMESNGYVDKFIGDAVMAFWGAPLEDAEHAVNSSRSALKMMTTLKKLNIDWGLRGLPPIDIGIGLNSGLMSVGNMGSESRFNYTVMGDAVNLGSRLEGLNKPYGTNIIISESTKKLLPPEFICRKLDLVTVKGKLEPVTIYELLAEGELEQEKAKQIKLFKEAFELYQGKQFSQAEKILNELQKKNPCVLHQEYLERVTAFCKNPPEANWDGVYRHKSK